MGPNLPPPCWVSVGHCTPPYIFIVLALLSNPPVSEEMSLTRKECKKAVYVVILFLFLIKPAAADQAPLLLSASEWIFIQCRKTKKPTRAEIVFCSHQLASHSASRWACAGYWCVWMVLAVLRALSPLSAPEVAWCTSDEELASHFYVTGENYTAIHSTTGGHSSFLRLQGKWHQGMMSSEVPSVPEYILYRDTVAHGHCRGLLLARINPAQPPWSESQDHLV